MNALFRRTPKEMVDAISIHQEDDSPLYSKPFRLALLISLSFVFIWNSVLFIFTSANAHSIYYHNRLGPDSFYADSSAASSQTILWLFWALIPFLIWSNSVFEVYKRWRRTLTSKRLVTTACISIFLWVVAVGYWSPCVFSSYVFGDGKPLTKQPSYCPFPKGGPEWRIWHHGASMPTAPRAYYLTPWLVIPALVFYICYLAIGAVALNREQRRNFERLLTLCAKCGGPVTAPEIQYKIASSVHSEADTLSSMSPSTLRTSLPPYGELSSARRSITSVEKT